MKAHLLLLNSLVILIFVSCNAPSLRSLSTDQINAILRQINENDEAFTQKEVSFDSIITLAGTRHLESKAERIKLKLFYFGDRSRGYYNLSDRDVSNLQIFGQKIEGLWVFKCVTKINMEEAGGYLIIQDQSKGIWSNGHVNFRKGLLELEKKYTDYNELEAW